MSKHNAIEKIFFTWFVPLLSFPIIFLPPDSRTATLAHQTYTHIYLHAQLNQTSSQLYTGTGTLENTAR